MSMCASHKIRQEPTGIHSIRREGGVVGREGRVHKAAIKGENIKGGIINCACTRNRHGKGRRGQVSTGKGRRWQLVANLKLHAKAGV